MTPQFEARTLLRRARLPADHLAPAGGFSNAVFMTPAHVVRLNEGRFPDAFRFEANVLAHLATDFPVPSVVDYGQREAGGEYLILDRLPGESVETSWPLLDQAVRQRIADAMAGLLRRLHAIPIAQWMRNPAVAIAIAEERTRDAYLAPMTMLPVLLRDARHVRPDAAGILDDVAHLVEERIQQILPRPDVFIHGDFHFRNLLTDGIAITGFLDFEGARIGPRDGDLATVVRWLTDLDKGMGSDARTIFDGFRREYPEFMTAPDLLPRLEVHQVIWNLVQTHHWTPGAHWMGDPAEALAEVVSGRYRDSARRLLDP